MKLNKANLAGLTSPGQQSEMKSILAGTWPPLKPLPVFKYETVEYRATIDFDRKRGEWVCRKTSLPSNEVQELRGGLREITMALPHGEAEVFAEGAEPQEQELEKDTNRRLQAIHEWREKYGNGARYFELRDFLSEGQRAELDDSLRLSLTARQLQFNSKNVADVFDDLSVAGGRFAALIELAKRSKANQGAAPQEQVEEGVAEVERACDEDKQTLEVSSRELGPGPNENGPSVQNQEASELRTDVEDFPAVSIKNVFPEQDQPSMAEPIAHISREFAVENSEIVDADSPSPLEDPDEEGRQSHVFPGFAAQVCAAKSPAGRIESSSWRFPRLEISAFQVNVFALLFLFAVTSFTVGLTVGRGPLGKRLREPPESLLAKETKPPTLPDAAEPDTADESSSRTPPRPASSSDGSDGGKEDGAPSEEKSKAGTPTAGVSGSESAGDSNSAETRPTDADSSATLESRPSLKSEISSERSGAIGPVARSISPLASSKPVRPGFKLLRRPKAVRSIRSAPRKPAPYKLASAIGSAPDVRRPSTVLVNLPGVGGQPFRVSFPNKTIAATSSLAMTSQLSVLVSPGPAHAVASRSARLEAGELVSYVWPRYSEPRGRYGLAETIKVRATIGPLGQVLDVKFLGGSTSLLPATLEAVRQWRYRPTLLDQRPVQVQQEITIEFRPPQYSARLSTQHPSHN